MKSQKRDGKSQANKGAQRGKWRAGNKKAKELASGRGTKMGEMKGFRVDQRRRGEGDKEGMKEGGVGIRQVWERSVRNPE